MGLDCMEPGNGLISTLTVNPEEDISSLDASADKHLFTSYIARRAVVNCECCTRFLYHSIFQTAVQFTNQYTG
jgi:hypothetical protein